MKSRLLSSIALALMAMLIGHTSLGHAKDAQNMQTAGERIAALPDSIDKTITALNDLIKNPKLADLNPQFKKFKQQLADTTLKAQNILKTHQSMFKSDKDFLAGWDKQLAQIKDEETKTLPESRKNEATEKLNAIKQNYAEMENLLTPFLEDLKDMEKFMAADLNARSVTAMRDLTTKNTYKAGQVNALIIKLAEDFKTSGLTTSVTKAVPAL